LAVLHRGERGEERMIAAKKEDLESWGAQVYVLQNPVTQIHSEDLRRMLCNRRKRFGTCVDTGKLLRAGNLQYLRCYTR